MVGDTINGRLIGKRGKDTYIRVLCSTCNKERWVKIRYTEDPPKNCQSCCNSRLGKKITWNKYLMVKLPKDSKFISMADKDRFVRYHRLVVAESLGRPLESWEIVHHINGDKQDNRLENLELMTYPEHEQVTILVEEVKRLRSEILRLKEKYNETD